MAVYAITASAPHFHGFRSLARTANTSVDNHRNIGVLDDHFNEIACAQALIRADHRAERHYASRARVFKTLRAIGSGNMYGMTTKPSLASFFRGLDGLLVVWQ